MKLVLKEDLMKKLAGAILLSAVFVGCSKGGDDGGGGAPPQTPVLVPGVISGDGIDNSLGMGGSSIQGRPIQSHSFSLIENSHNCDSGYQVDVRFNFDVSGMLSVVATIDTEAFGLTSYIDDPLAPVAQPTNRVQTFIARNVPYQYLPGWVQPRISTRMRSGYDRSFEIRDSRSSLGSIRINQVLAGTNAVLGGQQPLPQFPGSMPGPFPIVGPSLAAIEISTVSLRQNRYFPSRMSRPLMGSLLSFDSQTPEFDLTSRISRNEAVAIQVGSVGADRRFRPSLGGSSLQYCRPSLVADIASPSSP
jgi:hypothetical protein